MPSPMFRPLDGGWFWCGLVFAANCATPCCMDTGLDIAADCLWKSDIVDDALRICRPTSGVCRQLCEVGARVDAVCSLPAFSDLLTFIATGIEGPAAAVGSLIAVAGPPTVNGSPTRAGAVFTGLGDVAALRLGEPGGDLPGESGERDLPGEPTGIDPPAPRGNTKPEGAGLRGRPKLAYNDGESSRGRT